MTDIINFQHYNKLTIQELYTIITNDLMFSNENTKAILALYLTRLGCTYPYDIFNICKEIRKSSESKNNDDTSLPIDSDDNECCLSICKVLREINTRLNEEYEILENIDILTNKQFMDEKVESLTYHHLELLRELDIYCGEYIRLLNQIHDEKVKSLVPFKEEIQAIIEHNKVVKESCEKRIIQSRSKCKEEKRLQDELQAMEKELQAKDNELAKLLARLDLGLEEYANSKKQLSESTKIYEMRIEHKQSWSKLACQGNITILNRTYYIISMTYTINGEYVVTISSDCNIHVWLASSFIKNNRKCLITLPICSSSYCDYRPTSKFNIYKIYHSISFSADGTKMIIPVLRSNTAKVYNTNDHPSTWNLSHIINHGTEPSIYIRFAVISNNGYTAVTINEINEICLSNVNTGELIMEIEYQSSNDVCGVVFTKDDNYIIVINNYEFHIYSTSTGNLVNFIQLASTKLIPSDEITSMKISPNGTKLLISSNLCTIRLWSIDDVSNKENIIKSMRQFVDNKFRVCDVSFSPGGNLLISVNKYFSEYNLQLNKRFVLNVFDLGTDKCICQRGICNISNNDRLDPSSIAIRPDGNYVLIGGNQNMYVFSANDL